MVRTGSAWAPGLWALGLLLASPTVVRAASIGGRPDLPVLLRVPYVAQSELLCGGAAIAMVERWWGRRGVYAEEFASLVRPAAGGILTTELLIAVRDRGWQAQALRGTPALVQQSLHDSVPVVALIQVAPNRYHYVVIVGWDSGQVVFHDPAVAPFVVLNDGEFLQRWNGANRWAMMVRPAAAAAEVEIPRVVASVAFDSLPCRPWLDQAADAAAINHLADADRMLSVAAAECPTEPLVLRELAGVRFRQGRRAEAIRLADEYLRRAPEDALGWQLLASSRYLTGDAVGALAAWNTIGRPTVDLVSIEGIRHVRFGVAADALAIRAGDVLTPTRLALAQRRLADLPTLAATRVSYEAVAGGVVELRGAVVERPVVEPVSRILVATVLGAMVRREVGIEFNSPLGVGERWTVQWRWESADPGVSLRVEIPTRIGMPGVIALETSWEQYHFATNLPDEERRTATVGFATWAQPAVEMLAGARLERWTGLGNSLAFSVGGALHRWHDRGVFIARGEHGIPFDGTAAYTRVSSRLAWASTTHDASNRVSLRMGLDWASGSTPRGLWPIAGGDLSREIPLRAHSWIVDGGLATGQTAQSIMSGGLAGEHPVAVVGPVTIGVGVFLDGARLGPADLRPAGPVWYLDGGAGIRIGVSGATQGALRIDVGRGLLADPHWQLSVGLEQRWPLRVHPFR